MFQLSIPSGKALNNTTQCILNAYTSIISRIYIYIYIYSYNGSQQDVIFLKSILLNNFTCFGQICCPSSAVLTLSDSTSGLVRQYDFPVPLRCRKTSDAVFVALVLPLSEPVGRFSSCSTDFNLQIAQAVLFLFLCFSLLKL
jgi:hypothetical protein